MHSLSRCPPNAARAFTLVEILVSLGLFGLVSTAVLVIFIQASRIYKYDSFRLAVNHDIRTLTDELMDNATAANYFLVFPSLTSTTTTSSGVTSANSRADGLAGDFLLLVYKDASDSTNTNVNRIIGYFRASDPSSTTGQIPVWKFDKTITSTKVSVSSSDTTGTYIWSLLPTSVTDSTVSQIIPDSRRQGMSSGSTATTIDITDPADSTTTLGMFYNFYNRSIIINCKIQYSDSDGRTKRSISTYNFTVSPRG